MTDPIASVVIPAHNAAATIGEQLAGLAAQVGAPAFEVVVADNGSTDDTAAIVEQWADRVPGLRLVDASERRGPCAARNLGAAAATGRYLLFCDADDVAEPGWVAGMCRALDDHGIVGGELRDDALNSESVRAWFAGTPETLFEKFDHFLRYASGANLGIRRTVFDDIGGWDEAFVNATDADISFRAQLDGGAEIGFAAGAVVQYRYRDDLGAMARNMRSYGRADAQLLARFGDRGLTGRSLRQVIGSWVWLVVHLFDLRGDAAARGRWIRRANIAVGRLQGGLRHRVLA